MKRCMRHMSTEDVGWLCRAKQLVENIYAISGDSLDAFVPHNLKLPWCVLLLLGSHSRRHVHLSQKQICLKKIHRAARALSNKIKWRWHFRLAEEDPTKLLPLYRREPREYRDQADASVETFAREAYRTVMEQAVLANKAIARTRYSNKPSYVRIAIQWLKNQNLTAIQSDKDGVFTLIHNDVHNKLIREKLASLCHCYRRVYEDIHIIEHERLDRSVSSACFALKTSGHDMWGKECAEIFRAWPERFTQPTPYHHQNT